MPKHSIPSGPVFWDTDRQVPTVVMETPQLQVLISQFKNF